MLTNKPALFLTLFAFVALLLFFSRPLQVNTQRETTGLLIAFAGRLINPAGMNAGTCVRRLCASVAGFRPPPPFNKPYGCC